MYRIPQAKTPLKLCISEHTKNTLVKNFIEENQSVFQITSYYSEFDKIDGNGEVDEYLKKLSSATKEGENKTFSFSTLKATCNISYDKSSLEETLFTNFLLSQIMSALADCLVCYLRDEKYRKLITEFQWKEKIWRNIEGEHFNPMCVNDLSKRTANSDPSTLIFLLCPITDSDPTGGFGLYLLDENDQLIFKTIYKFFDLPNAPTDAFRLNVPKTLDKFFDTSRYFFK
ncbi:hypothetical protein [Acinetobacter sp. BHS4]|uniref:hypothetical protein n=1 Tax=Acinetobacter sp. BHS4 TaxID=2836181 RepID=UPI001BCCD360|nr:hypothetical protein [Acinetobacter sp. BHS4]QVR68224.1 hypothetical protein KIP84_01110 [Acinetobacter sp. BHS4]